MRRIAVVWLAASCAEYSVTLEQVSDAPLPVVLASNLEMPVGIVVTGTTHPFKNDEELDPNTNIELVIEDPTVLDITVVVDDPATVGLDWAFAGVSAGTTTLWPRVGDHEAGPIDVLITEQ